MLPRTVLTKLVGVGLESRIPSAKYEFETGTFNKRAEISVPRDQRNAAVDAALSDQSITEPRLSMLRQNSSPQPACPVPIPGVDVDQR
jgi:hypothetical protein